MRLGKPIACSQIDLYASQGLDLHPSPGAPTPETILALRKKLQETKKLNRALRQESDRNDAIISQLRSILSTVKTPDGATSAKQEGDVEVPTLPENKDLDLSFLTESPAARQLRIGAATGPNTQHTPLTTNTTFILSQLPALQALLKQLRPKLATLSKSANTTEANTNTKRDERKEYIESRIRLHLERTGQLGVGSDGNPVVAGRKIDISEAQALETVTGMLTQGDKMSE
jgi:kinetochore protein Mis12/MTW1